MAGTLRAFRFVSHHDFLVISVLLAPVGGLFHKGTQAKEGLTRKDMLDIIIIIRRFCAAERDWNLWDDLSKSDFVRRTSVRGIVTF